MCVWGGEGNLCIKDILFKRNFNLQTQDSSSYSLGSSGCESILKWSILHNGAKTTQIFKTLLELHSLKEIVLTS